MSRRRQTHEHRALPTVNLLSEADFALLAARRLRHRFLAGGLALLVLIGAACGVQQVRISQANTVLAVEQAETSRLDGETQALAPVSTFVNGVAMQKQTVQQAMAGEVYLSEVLGGIRDAAPAGAQLTAVAVTLSAGTDPGAAVGGATPATCPGPDPFNTRVVVGCVTLSGTAASRAEVGRMVIALGNSSLFVEPFISTTTTADSTEVTFNGSVGLSEKVYSKRYGAPAPTATEGAAGATTGVTP